MHDGNVKILFIQDEGRGHSSGSAHENRIETTKTIECKYISRLSNDRVSKKPVQYK